MIALIGVLLFAFFSCADPFEGRPSGPLQEGAGSAVVELRFLPQGMHPATVVPSTVMPDFTGSIEDWKGRFTCRDHGTEISWEIPGAETTHQVDTLYPGTWDLIVEGLDQDGTVLASGAREEIPLQSGPNDPLAVAVEYLQDDQDTSGSLSLRLAWPLQIGITRITASIEGLAGMNATYESADFDTSDPGTPRVTISLADIPGGAHSMVISFYTPPADPDPVLRGTFREAMNIWTGQVSNRWIDPSSGDLLEERLFSADEFLRAANALSDFSFVAGELKRSGSHESGFNAGHLDYTISLTGGEPLRFVAAGAAEGQKIEYSWDGGPWIGILSGALSPILDHPERKDLRVAVTGPDRVSRRVYTITCYRTYRLSYDPNGGTGTVSTQTVDSGVAITVAEATGLTPPGYTGENLEFHQWSTARAGGGEVYDPGDQITLSGDTTLFAQWREL
ncbi:repeat domain (List_Bact_rpt) [Alkalispirochaeta americana]|uniref:Repeat domain (List_Bact_rpt) n=1 Tax=Alkalispirochaeta americana TaxID=159291 RepID=A0A1N6UKK2_9SPIO|nr:InlB B-repeat-containing protein [Alkalispirochaeta americana]SIQ65856.1 repeat domain (List_Bact_rpt) [Alkalispirochaeta americana]